MKIEPFSLPRTESWVEGSTSAEWMSSVSKIQEIYKQDRLVQEALDFLVSTVENIQNEKRPQTRVGVPTLQNGERPLYRPLQMLTDKQAF